MNRVLIDKDPNWSPGKYQFQSKPWDASWIGPNGFEQDGEGVWAFARKFKHSGGSVRVHVSADQRYHLYVDGKRIARGPERSDLKHWMYNSYDLDLSAGEHVIVAIVWWCSPTGKNPPPWAQETQRPGFLLMAERDSGKNLSTGASDYWLVKPINAITFNNFATGQWYDGVIGYRIVVDGDKYPWGVESGLGDGWSAAKKIQEPALRVADRETHPYWLLRPSVLPEMKSKSHSCAKVRYVASESNSINNQTKVDLKKHLADEASAWQKMIDGKSSVTIPANTQRRIILDLETYLCAYTELTVTGGKGSKIRIGWAESLFEDDHATIKKNRTEIDGRRFIGFYDEFHPGEGNDQAYESLWWKSGRYVEVLIETASQPITINRIDLVETGYPYQFESTFDASDARLKTIIPIAQHTLKMCSFETSMDCPYYEQLNYCGDTRIQSLVAMHSSSDDRLVKKSIQLFNWSRDAENWSLSRAPTRRLQVIPPFSMWWIAMVYDYAMYRGELKFIKSIMPGARAVIERWREQIDDKGMVVLPVGWNFVDWVMGWDAGMSNPSAGQHCAIVQWHLVYTLELMSKLETMINEPLLAQRHTQTASMLAATAERAFFDQDKGCFADNPEKTNYSQHAQIMAILSEHLSHSLKDRIANRLLTDDKLAPASIYFRHYLFEAYAQLGQTDQLISKLDFWFEHLEKNIYTTIEMGEPSRSDCHAWGAHPVYHYYSSILGIKPAAFGFEKVMIHPQLGSMEWAQGEMIHPKGKILADISRQGGKITLPSDVTGVLYWKDQTIPLKPGENVF